MTVVKIGRAKKNTNTGVNKSYQELEEEFKRIKPEGDQIDMSTLKLAILILNPKLRKSGNSNA